MKRIFLVFVVLMTVLFGCQSGGMETGTGVNPTQLPPTAEPESTPIPPTATAPPPTEKPETTGNVELEQALQAVVDAQVEAGFPGAILMVDAPDMNFTWKGAAGMANVDAKIPMEADMSVRLGGITNMLTAAVVMKLAEEGLIDLDDPISQHLDTAVTDQLIGPDGEPYGETITVRQLLNHTSGVTGYFFTEDRDNNNVDDFVDIIIDDPQKVWNPPEAVAHVANNMEPQFAPGEGWGYSDTNFILLGMIIEASIGQSLGEAYQDWLFEPLDMSDTYLAQIGDARLDDVSHVYYEDLDVSEYPSLSWQWGVGGIVTTADDLNHFMWALVNDDLFSDPASKEAMMEWTSMAGAGYDGIYSGLGILQVDFEEFGMPEIGKIQGHNGMWNGFIYYWPQHNIVLTGTLNQVLPMGAYTGLTMPAMQTVLPYVAEE